MDDKGSPTILVIDNDEDLVRAVRTRLESAGYRCLTANTGAQGLSCFSKGGIDLIITDLNMPVLDGVGLAKKIRQCSDVPIIIITGFPNEYMDRVRHFRGVTVLGKPFNASILVNLIDNALVIRGKRIPA